MNFIGLQLLLINYCGLYKTKIVLHVIVNILDNGCFQYYAQLDYTHVKGTKFQFLLKVTLNPLIQTANILKTPVTP
jgi:hypothetical protein